MRSYEFDSPGYGGRFMVSQLSPEHEPTLYRHQNDDFGNEFWELYQPDSDRDLLIALTEILRMVGAS